jgi:hypothetical protein
VLASVRDITERKRRERAIQALQDATERLQSAQTPEEVATVEGDWGEVAVTTELLRSGTLTTSEQAV